jgi:hypothetical protein
MANLRQERIEQGLCRDCGEPRTDEGTAERCPTHAAEHSQRQAERNDERREGWRAKGLCVGCGEARTDGRNGKATPTLCGDCAHLQREATKRYERRLQLVA